MNVLHIFNQLDFSGAEIMYVDAAHIFKKNKIKLFALSTGEKFGNYTNQFKDSGFKIFHKSYNPRYLVLSYSGLRFYFFLSKLLIRLKIDTIHIHRSDIYFPAVLAYFLRIKCVKTQHSVFESRIITRYIGVLRRYLTRRLFGLVFHTIGQSVYDNELTYYKNPSNRINNWYNSERFFPSMSQDEKKSMKENIGLPAESFVIITAGRCTDGKRHTHIIQALSKINDKNIYYLHLGSGIEEDSEKAESQQLGLSGNILFLGNQNNVRDYLIASDVFIMPSKFEGLSIAAIEAMACNVLLILYNVPGLRDMINNDDNGYLIKENVAELVKSIKHVRNNPLDCNEKITNAFNYVRSHHDIFINTKKVIDLYAAK